LWHDEQAPDAGCDAVHVTPGFLWQVEHETARLWPEGGRWHDEHDDDV
jgi:hypothetical protein